MNWMTRQCKLSPRALSISHISKLHVESSMLDDLDQDLDNTQSKLTGVRKTVDRVIKMADGKLEIEIVPFLKPS